MALPFDTVVVEEGGRLRRLSTDEFLALDLPTRIRHVMSGRIEFLAKGLPVRKSEALSAIKKRNTRPP